MSFLEAMQNNSSKPASHRKQNASEIQNYFRGKNVLVTGGTGFLGKLIIEKLLRVCEVKKIYVLARAKKGKAPSERLKQLFDIPAFELLRKQTPGFTDKIVLRVGDCLELDLGLSQEDTGLLKEEVNCIVHCAATVRFDASLRKATYINVRATRDLIRMAKDMKQLTSFIYVSTAYSHCPRTDIDEKIYEPPIKAQNLMNLVEALDDDVLDAITPILIGQWPNTYTFTKAVAEEVVKIEGRGLPVSIVKPSIITSSLKEPLPGWIDNFYGLSGLALAGGLGLLRTLHCDNNIRVDLIPADYVVNSILAAAWNVGQRTTPEIKAIENQDDPTVYNCNSGCQNPVNFTSGLKQLKKHGSKIPSRLIVWYSMFVSTNNFHLYLLYEFLLHTIPAYIVDFVLLCVGKQPMLVDGYKKIGKLSRILSYFGLRQWNFKDTNFRDLWNKLNLRDKELFEFDVRGIDWDVYFRSYALGMRIYILKDPLETLPEGRRKLRILKVAHYTILTTLSVSLIFLLTFVIKIVFSINY